MNLPSRLQTQKQKRGGEKHQEKLQMEREGMREEERAGERQEEETSTGRERHGGAEGGDREKGERKRWWGRGRRETGGRREGERDWTE